MGCGERMGLSITAVLASVASEIIIEGKLPQTQTTTWIHTFTLGSLLFAVFPLFESAIVIHLHHKTNDHLYPTHMHAFFKQLRHRRKKKETFNAVEETEPPRENLVSSDCSTSETVADAGNNSLNDHAKNGREKWRDIAYKIDEISCAACLVSYPLFVAILFASVGSQS